MCYFRSCLLINYVYINDGLKVLISLPSSEEWALCCPLATEPVKTESLRWQNGNNDTNNNNDDADDSDNSNKNDVDEHNDDDNVYIIATRRRRRRRGRFKKDEEKKYEVLHLL